jgi:hypothetical protein
MFNRVTSSLQDQPGRPVLVVVEACEHFAPPVETRLVVPDALVMSVDGRSVSAATQPVRGLFQGFVLPTKPHALRPQRIAFGGATVGFACRKQGRCHGIIAGSSMP